MPTPSQKPSPKPIAAPAPLVTPSVPPPGDRKREDKADMAAVAILLLLGLAAGAWLLLGRAGGGPPAGASPFGRVETTTPLKRRFTGDLRWGQIGPGDEVYLQDVLYIPPGTVASVVPLRGGKSIPLPADAMVHFRGDGPVILNAGADAIDVAELEKSREPGAVIPLPDPEPFAAKLADLTRRVAQRPAALRITDVPAQPRIELKLDRLEYYLLQLVTPVEVTFKHKLNAWYDTVWTPVPIDGVNFTVEISKDPKFERFLSHLTTRSRMAIQLDQTGVFYWRVRATLRDEAISSEPARFALSKRGTDTAAVSKISKMPQAKMTGYTAEIASDESFRNIVSMQMVTNADCGAARVAPGTYFCRVLPISGAGASRSYRFQVDGAGRTIFLNELAVAAPAPPSIGARAPAVQVAQKAAEPDDDFVADPNGYTVEISTSAEFRDLAGSSYETSPQCPTAGLPPGSYHCRVSPASGGKKKQYKFDVK